MSALQHRPMPAASPHPHRRPGPAVRRLPRGTVKVAATHRIAMAKQAMVYQRFPMGSPLLVTTVDGVEEVG